MMSTLLVTSTISPDADVYLIARKDPQLRLNDYVEALPTYLNLIKARIIDNLVYADNSGFDLTPLRTLAEQMGVADKCEFISFKSLADPEVSRYFLEVDLIRYVILNSVFLKENTQYVWKVTGRYRVKNAASIIRESPSDGDVYVNCRNHPYKTVDFYFLRFNMAGFYKLVSASLDDFKSRRNGEDILRERIDSGFAPDIKVIPRFNVTPQLLGTRGFDGARYGGLKYQAKQTIRRVLNRIFPNFWL